MASPNDRKYAATHEWHKLDDKQVTIGLSRFAVDKLTDITYLEVTRTDGAVAGGDALGEIESVKGASDIYTAVAGQIVAVNQAVLDDPAIINQDPYDKGWIIKIQVQDESQLDSLMTSEQYDQSHDR